jgi:hypothetical protein
MSEQSEHFMRGLTGVPFNQKGHAMKLRKNKLLAYCLLTLLLGSLVAAGADRIPRITAAQAKDHIGETATVCVHV